MADAETEGPGTGMEWVPSCVGNSMFLRTRSGALCYNVGLINIAKETTE